MAKKAKAPRLSVHISGFCSLMASVQGDYEWNRNEVNRLDMLTQDYLHKLELEKLSYGERAKIATNLSRCRQLRRECKDTVEILRAFDCIYGK